MIVISLNNSYNSNISFRVTKQAIVNTKYFVYHDKQYPVNFDLLKINSIYFYQNQDKFQNEQCIELIDEKEECIKLSEESIKAFISSCQNEQCSIDKSSIIPLQYLAYKYEFKELIKIIDQIFEDHTAELIFSTLFFKIYKMKEKNCNKSFFDTSKEEQFISDHLQDLIQKEEMLCLPIEFIYRILTLFFRQQQNKELNKEMTIFLFNCLEKYGKCASSLFNVVDFGEQRIEVVNRLLENYSNEFDFNMINHTLTKTVKDLTSEIAKQKEEYSMMFKQMQETFKEQLTELKKLKKQEEQKLIQNEIEDKKRIENFSSDVDKIKKDFEEKINSTQDQFKQICKKQEEFIDNAIVKKYLQMVLETITFGQFLKFDDKLKDHFLSELFKNENKQSSQENLLRAKIILYLYSIPESYDYIQIVQLLTKNANDQASIKITNDKIEDLYQKGQLDSCLTNCANLFRDLLVEIEYPCKKSEQIMQIISEIKAQNDQKMRISVTIKDKSYFEQENKWSKIINICKIGKSIEVIPEKSFCEFNNLSILELSPDTVTIESSSFKNCSSLAQIKIPEKVKTIGDYSFQNCFSLTEITIPTSVKSIGDHCFDGCSKLDRITINPFYTRIQYNTFNKCPSLEHFTISTARDNKSKTNGHILITYNIADILYQTNFFKSSEITSYINECSEIIFEIQYPSSNYSNIYQQIINLRQNHSSKIKISIFCSQMETTDKYFNDNKEINYVRFDSNIKRTPNDGDDSSNGFFQNCSSLIEVFIPSSMNKIGNRTFYGCSSLTKINFESPSSVTSFGKYAFYSCKSLTQMIFPSSVISIEEFSFCSCSSLTQISIPSSVTFIGSSAFNSCTSLTQISFSIPSSVTSFERCVFCACSSLKQISIPSSVTSIGYSAFASCKSLTQILIPSSVTSIGEGAFQSCTSLSQISIPSSVTSIGKKAFESCSLLAQISFSIPSSVTSIEEGAFYECSSLTQITIPSPVTSIGINAFYKCSSLKQVSISSSVISIERCAFELCKSLTQVSFSIPSSLTSIGDNAFYECSSLTQVSIPSPVKSIGDYAFYGCSSLTQISIPSSATSVGGLVLGQCQSLRQITVPSNINTGCFAINSNVTINRI